MKRFIIFIAVLLIVGHMFTYSSAILSQIYPEIMSKKANLFKHGGVVMEYWWYIKFTCDDFLWVITFFALTTIAYRYSVRLAMVSFIFLLYHLFDGIMFWDNYKSSKWEERGLMIAVIISVIFLVIPAKKWDRGGGKYRSMI